MSEILNPYFVYINSANRISGTDENFTYNIQFPPDKDFTHVVLIDALIPKSYYLAQVGSTFTLRENGFPDILLTVIVGCYTLQAFMNQIGILLTNNSPNGYTYTLTYPALNSLIADTGKITYTCSDTSSTQYLIFNNLFYEPFGFDDNSTNQFNAGTLISSNVIKMQSEDRLLIHTNCVQNPNTDDVLISINASTYLNYSSINFVNCIPAYTAKELSSKHQNTVSIQLTNESATLQKLNGLNMNMTLCFYKKGDLYTLMKNFFRLLLHDDSKYKTLEQEP